MKKVTFLWIFWLLSLLFLAVQAEATTRTVASSCTGQPSPCYTTAQAAANAAVAGDTVYFRAGTYGGFSVTNSGTLSNRIIFRNYPNETVTLLASSGRTGNCAGAVDTAMICIDSKNYITIDGLNVAGTRNGTQAQGNVVIENGGFIDLLNSEISFGYANGIFISGTAHDVLVQNNIVHDNVQMNIEQTGQYRRGTAEIWGGGVNNYQDTYNITYRNNAIYWNHGEGITVGGHDNLIEGNVIADNWSTNLYFNYNPANSITQKNFIYNSNDAINYPTVKYEWDNNPPGITHSNENGGGAIHDLTYHNNIIVNTALGIQAWGVISAPVYALKIYNNTIVTFGGQGIIWENSGSTISDVIIRNNIITGKSYYDANSMVVFTPAPSNFTVSNNIYNGPSGYRLGGNSYADYATWQSATNDSGSITSDPQLVNGGLVPCRLWTDPRDGSPGCSVATLRASIANNYKPVSATSPAYNAGVDLGAPFNTDYVGVSRPQGGLWDIGAFEFALPAAAPQLVAAYGFDSIEGQTVYDSSGLNNNGTMDATVVVDSSGKYGKALLFNGSNAVTVPNSASLSFMDGLTIEAWVNVPTAPTTPTAVMAKFYDYYLYVNSEPWQCAGQRAFGGAVTSGTGVGQYVCDSTVTFPTNTWVHLAVTYDGSTFLFYRDGQITSSRSGNGAMTASSGPLYIGNSGFPEYLTGKIDELRIYTGALTQSQIQFDMTNPITPIVPPEKIIQIAPPNTLELSATDGALQIGE